MVRKTVTDVLRRTGRTMSREPVKGSPTGFAL